MMKRHVYILVVSAVLLTLFVSCRKSDASGSELLDRSPVVVMLCSPNGLGDVNYEDRMYGAACRMAHENGLRTYCISPETRYAGVKQLVQYLKGCKGDGIRRLYVAFSPMYEGFINEILADFPDDGTAQMLMVSPPMESELVHTAGVRTYGLYYTAGVLAASEFPGENDTIGCEYDVVDPYVREAGEAFEDGALSCTSGYVDMFYNDGNNYDEEYYYMSDYLYIDTYLLGEWCHNFYLFLYKPYFKATVIRDPETIRDFHTAGVDMDFSMYSDKVMFSCVRRMDLLMENCIRQWLSPEGLPKDQQYGFDTEYTEMVFSPGYEYMKPLADSIFSEAVAREKEHVLGGPRRDLEEFDDEDYDDDEDSEYEDIE